MTKNNDPPKWKIDSSAYVYNDRFLKLRADNCTTPQGGKVDKYFVLECADWVNCLTIDAEGNAVMLKNYRHGVQEYITEFVAGSIDPHDASPEAAMRRELEEEAGYTGGTLYHVGTSYPNPANHTNKVYSFLAIGGNITKAQNLEVGETIIVEKMSLKTVVEQMSAHDTVYPSMIIATLFHAINFIHTSNDRALEPLKKYL